MLAAIFRNKCVNSAINDHLILSVLLFNLGASKRSDQYIPLLNAATEDLLAGLCCGCEIGVTLEVVIGIGVLAKMKVSICTLV